MAAMVFLLRPRSRRNLQPGQEPPCSQQRVYELEQPAELPFCSCWYEYVVSPRALPDELLTAKGRAWLAGSAAIAS